MIFISIILLIMFFSAGCGQSVENTVIRPAEQKPEQTEMIKKGSIAEIADFPAVKNINAKVGDYVLAIGNEFLQNPDGAKVFYAAKLMEKGEYESKIQWLNKDEEIVPNAVIVPIRGEETAEPGDIVLTWWQSGSGMQRAYVTGGAPERPEVMYLDIDYFNPSGAGKKKEILKPNTFHKLNDNDIGSAAACLNRGERVLVRVVNKTEDKVLGSLTDNSLMSFDKEDCVFIPNKVEVEPGDLAFVPVDGTITAVMVKKVEQSIGRIFVEYNFGRELKEDAIAFGNVLTEVK